MGIIHRLSTQDARRIAAGEVIDRPASILRELLDNAIDAGATEIEVRLLEGGIREIRVIDNGSGMCREDLEMSFQSHATSKISVFEDIYRTRTLGFRGEALSSIAACSRLTIVSGQSAEESAHRLDVQGGSLKSITPSGPMRGTVVTVQDVFYSMPGRKNFLKRPSSEMAVCKQQFFEKTIPHPGIAFRLFADGDLKILATAGELSERIRALYPEIPWNNQMLDIRETGDSATSVIAAGERTSAADTGHRGNAVEVHIIAGTPAIERRDRKLIQIYVNRRRINEFALVQAVEYAFSTVMPGGAYPAAFVLLSLDPQTVDFNIHPAKREAKFRNLPEVHRKVQAAIRARLQRESDFSPAGAFNAAQAKLLSRTPYSPESGSPLFFGEEGPVFSLYPQTPYTAASPGPFTRIGSRLRSDQETPGQPATVDTGGARYLGQVFGMFLLVEWKNLLYFIDQHAAHERILYASYEAAEIVTQPLLTPYPLDLEDDQTVLIREAQPALAELGIIIEKTGQDCYSIVSVPANARGEEKDLSRFIVKNMGNTNDIRKLLFADLSCRKAVKEGEYVDALTARELITGVFAKGLTHCPHGRPLFFTLSRDKMAELVGRTGPVF